MYFFLITSGKDTKEISILFKDKINLSMIQRKEVVVTNASMKYFSIGGCWIRVGVENITSNRKRIFGK